MDWPTLAIIRTMLTLALGLAPALCSAAVAPGNAAELRAPPADVCYRSRCTFTHGAMRVQLSGETLQMQRAGTTRQLARIDGVGDEVRMAALSSSGNVLALGIANITQSRRAFGGGLGARPDDLDRSFRIELYNPKSGSLIKTFDLGAFSPQRFGLSADGAFIFVAGQDLERREIEEARVLNARNGRLEFSTPVRRPARVRIAENGFEAESGSYLLVEANVGGRQTYFSRDPFSIAEYEVECTDALTSDGPMTVGVMDFADAATNQGDVFASALSSGLGAAGLRTVERGNLRAVLEELQLSAMGITESELALDIGELGVATHMIFGEASRAGANIALATRLVAVEEGVQVSSCTLLCRDCSDGDLFEGLGRLSRHWLRTSTE